MGIGVMLQRKELSIYLESATGYQEDYGVSFLTSTPQTRPRAR